MMSHKKTTFLQTALKLFNQYGFGNIGVDRIIAESDVAKMTFYKHFGSKDNLIVECLKAKSIAIQKQITQTMQQGQLVGKTKLDCVIDYYQQWFYSSDFFGSLFVKAVNEFPESKAVSDIASQHQQSLLLTFTSILGNEKKALNLLLLLDGATVHEKIYRDKTSIYFVKQALKKEGYYEII